MIRITDKANCCGCSSCVQACPKQCITMQQDEEGFLYPTVKENICIKCGLCERVCPVLNKGINRTPLFSYAAKNDNEAERLQSSSGGIFIILAKSILENGGVVFGARFDDDWNVVHSYTDSVEGMKPFMGSKYVQSQIGKSYVKAREFLDKGRKVLFSGTPCQIAGLKLFLRKDYENLLTVDVICHGVPSPAVWNKYLEEIKENARQGENTVSSPLIPSFSESDALVADKDVKIESISFRDKRLGWKKFSFALTLAEAAADGKKNSVLLSHIHNEDPYFLGFNNYNLYLRPSCMKCPSRDLSSGSDITLADFWGIDTLLPELDDDKGVSVIMTNTEKGNNIICSLGIKLYSVNYADVLSRNTSITVNSKPTPSTIRDIIEYKLKLPTKRDYFFYDTEKSIIKRINKLTKPTFKQQVRKFLVNLRII